MKLDLTQPEPLRDFLIESAPLAHKLAQQHCQEAAKSDMCNGSYHGIWHYLRLLDLVASPLRSAEFYLHQLSACANDSSYPNVLISGAADYAMMALVAESYCRFDADLKLFQLDVCRTPLLIGDWYAEKCGLPKPVSIQADIMNVSLDEKMDIIVTHSFLAQFDPAMRGQLIRSWHDMLRSGGLVITCVRIDSAATGGLVKNTSQQVAAFRDLIQKRLENLSIVPAGDKEALVNDAAHFSATRASTPIRTVEEVIELFDLEGFETRKIDMVEKPGNSKIDGPAVKKPALYAHLVMQKKQI